MKSKGRMYLSMLVSIALSMSMVVIVLGILLFTILEKNSLEAARTYNESLLEETGKCLSTASEMNMSFARTQLSDYDVQAVLSSSKQDDMFPIISVIRKIQKILPIHPMIDSVTIYNGTTGQFYATSGDLWQDQQELVQQLMDNRDNAPLFILPYLPADASNSMLCYVAAERDDQRRISAAVIVSVKAKGLLNQVDDAITQTLLLAMKDGTLLSRSKRDTLSLRTLPADLIERAMNTPGASFTYTLEDVEWVVNCQRVPHAEWLLISLQPYEVFSQATSLLRWKIILVVLLTVSAACVIAYLVAGRLYRPIGRVVNQVAQTAAVPIRSGDIDYLQDVFSNQQKQLDHYRNYKADTLAELRRGALKNLLLDNETVLMTLQQQDENLMPFTPGEAVYLAVMTIANYRHLPQEDVSQRNMIRFIVSNISDELMQPLGTTQTVPMSGGRVALICACEDTEGNQQRFEEIMESVATNVMGVVEMQMSVVFCSTRFTQTDLSRSWQELQQLTRYTLLYGLESILYMPQSDQQRQAKMIQYPKKTETELLQAIRNHREETALQQLEQMLDCLCTGSLVQYLDGISRMELALRQLVDQLNERKFVKICVDFEALHNQCNTAESNPQMRDGFTVAIREILQQLPMDSVQKNHVLVTNVLKSIEQHYHEPELCAKSLAASFGISSAYLATLFREDTGQSVQERINQVRMNHAQQLVLGTELPIHVIMQKCGLESTTSFYRLYKAACGVSPKEHRLAQRINEKEEDANG